MKNTVIAVKGVSNCGKTFTIKEFYKQLKSKYPITEQKEYNIEGVEIQKILDLKGVKIGIKSKGDPGSQLDKSLKIFLKEKCNIIVCATRTRGKTVNDVKELVKSGYKIKWIKKVKDNDLTNAKTIALLFNYFENVLNDEY